MSLSKKGASSLASFKPHHSDFASFSWLAFLMAIDVTLRI